MQTEHTDRINAISQLEKSYLDHNETKQKIDKRIWSIAARIHGPKNDGTFDKKAVGDMQKSVIKGKCVDVLLASLTSDLVAARNMIAAREQNIADEMAELANGLPAYDWFVGHRGIKDVMYARLIANAGADLMNFPGPANLWSRFGLGVADGKALRPKAGEKLAFSPRRRAFAIGVLGTQLMMQNPRWKKVYDWRKQYERDQAEAQGKTVKASSAITPKQQATGKFMSDGHVHARARRYMVKQFLKAFWEEWTGQSKPEELPGFLLDKASDKIMDGLTDALAYAGGDTNRGTAHEVEIN